MRYVFSCLLVLLIFFGGCEKNKEKHNDTEGQGEYSSSAYSTKEEDTCKKTELLTDAESGFGEIYIID